MHLSDDSCKNRILSKENERAMIVNKSIGTIDGNSDIYRRIVDLNSYDMELYWYAFELFKEQQLWVNANRSRRWV